jgi:carbon storage regulator CsrA
MLILSRQAGEVIFLTDSTTNQRVAEITITNIRPRTCTLGITSPDHIAICRKEIYGTERGKPKQ